MWKTFSTIFEKLTLFYLWFPPLNYDYDYDYCYDYDNIIIYNPIMFHIETSERKKTIITVSDFHRWHIFMWIQVLLLLLLEQSHSFWFHLIFFSPVLKKMSKLLIISSLDYYYYLWKQWFSVFFFFCTIRIQIFFQLLKNSQL